MQAGAAGSRRDGPWPQGLRSGRTQRVVLRTADGAVRTAEYLRAGGSRCGSTAEAHPGGRAERLPGGSPSEAAAPGNPERTYRAGRSRSMLRAHHVAAHEAVFL